MPVLQRQVSSDGYLTSAGYLYLWYVRAEYRRRKHLLHPLDLGRLIGADVRGHLVDRDVLRGSIGAEKVVHHRDCSAVVLDHEGEE